MAKRGGWGESAKAVGLALVLAFGVRTAVAESFHVPSASMVPTLLVGDFLFANKMAYGYSRYSLPVDVPGVSFHGRLLDQPPQRGDVAVFRLPRDPDQVYVKRIVAVAGDRVRVSGGVLHLNGEQTPLRRVADFDGTPQFMETLPGGVTHRILHAPGLGALDETPEVRVPDGHVFVMGDNRSNSLDSRVPAAQGGVGTVPVENLIGRVDLRYFSVDFDTDWSDPAAWPKALRPERIGPVS